MKKILSALIVVVMLFSFAGCDKRGTDIEEVEKNDKIVIGVTDNKPMTYKENGEWKGFDIELAHLFAAKLGVEPEFVEVGAAEKYDLLKDYSVDCIWSGITIGNYTQEGLTMSDPYVDNSQVLVMKADVVGNYQNGYDTRELKFAVQTDSSGFFCVEREMYKNVELVETQSEALSLVSDGTVDAAIVDGIAADVFVGEGKKYPDLAKGFSYSLETYGVAFRENSDIAKSFNEFLNEQKDNALWEIAEKYGLTVS